MKSRCIWRSGAKTTSVETGRHGDLCVMVRCEPPAMVLGEAAAGRARAAFEQRARLQQLMGERSGHWIAVEDFGCQDGASWLRRRFAHISAEDLIRFEIDLDEVTLYRLISGVVIGLTDLLAHGGRAHGALKASNVLLCGDALNGDTAVCLTDPAAVRPNGGAISEASDLHALGGLIYRLVLHREPPRVHSVTVSSGPEWRRLGRRGEVWRQLCAGLLDANPATRLSSLDCVAGALGQVRPPSRALRRTSIAAALFVLVGLAGYSTQVVMRGEMSEQTIVASPEYTPEAWDRLRADSSWTRYLLEPRRFQNSAAIYRRHEHLSKVAAIVERQESQKILFAPDVYVALSSSQMADGTPSYVVSAAGVEDLRRANDVAASLRTEFLEWIDELEAQARAFEHRSWEDLASVLRKPTGALVHRITSTEANEPDIPFHDLVFDVLNAENRAAEVSQAWGELEPTLLALEETGDPVLASLRSFAESQVAGVSPRRAAFEIAVLRRDIALPLESALASRAYSRLDREWFEATSESHELLRQGNGPSEAMFLSWISEVSDPRFARVDPRNDPRDRRAVGQTWSQIERLSSRLQNNDIELSKDARLSLERLRIRWRALENVPYSRQTEERLEWESQAVAEASTLLLADMRSALESALSEEGAYFREVRNRETLLASTAVSPALDGVWERTRDQWIEMGLAPDELRTRVDALERFFGDCIRELEGELVIADAARGVDQAALNAILENQRERILSDVIGGADLVSGRPDASDRAFGRRWDRAVADYVRAVDAVRGFARDFTTVEAALDGGHSLTEPIDSSGRTLGDIIDFWRGQNAINADRLLSAVAQIEERFSALRKFASNERLDRRALAAIAADESTRPEIRFAAWRRLGAGMDDPDALRQEQSLFEPMNLAIRTMSDSRRQRQLVEEFRRERARRWTAFASAAKDDRTMRAALDLIDEFEIRSDELSPAMLINRLIHEFKVELREATLQTVDADDRSRRLVQGYVTEINQTGDDRHRAMLANLIADLRALNAGGVGEPELAFSEVGPGDPRLPVELRWVLDEGASTPERLVFRWSPGSDQSHELAFVRVESPSGSFEPVYVCETELSVGLVNALIRESGRAGHFADLHSPAANADRASDGRLGPRTWQWRRRQNLDQGIEPPQLPRSNPWLIRDAEFGAGGVPHYADGVDAASPGQRPSLDHPIQRISPHAASFVAGLMGCRLPSSSEWMQALADERRAHGSQSLDAYIRRTQPNLRDETWRLQRDHMIAAGAMRTPWPDLGSFWPRTIALRDRALDGSAAQAVAYNDGVLWFDVTAEMNDRSFSHLIGNVAEYVFDAPEALERAAGDAMAVRAVLDSSPDLLGVIGGSSMSAPAIALDQRQPVDMLAAAEGFADVGVRLAFSARGAGRPRPLAARVLARLNDQRYILE